MPDDNQALLDLLDNAEWIEGPIVGCRWAWRVGPFARWKAVVDGPDGSEIWGYGWALTRRRGWEAAWNWTAATRARLGVT